MVNYPNAARKAAAGFQVFGVNLPDTFETTDGYTLNTSVWPATVWDFSGCPLANTVSPLVVPYGTGALITPRHVLGAAHYMSTAGAYYFITPGGTKITRTVVDFSATIIADVRIVTLDEAVEGCAIYRVPTPESLATLLDQTILCLDKQRTVVTRTVNSSTGGSGFIFHSTDESGLTLIPGDSGQPAFINVGTELVLLGTGASAQGLSSTGYSLSAIQDYCDETSQTVQTVSIDPATWVQPLAAAL